MAQSSRQENEIRRHVVFFVVDFAVRSIEKHPSAGRRSMTRRGKTLLTADFLQAHKSKSNVRTFSPRLSLAFPSRREFHSLDEHGMNSISPCLRRNASCFQRVCGRNDLSPSPPPDISILFVRRKMRDEFPFGRRPSIRCSFVISRCKRKRQGRSGGRRICLRWGRRTSASSIHSENFHFSLWIWC